MTILDAIRQVDSLRHNTFTQEEKVQWLARVDGMIYKDVLSTHEGCPDFQPYTEDTPLDQVLLVEAPYEELYLHWLQTFMDFYEDVSHFNQSLQMFTAAYDGYKDWYNRTHRPLGRQFSYV